MPIANQLPVGYEGKCTMLYSVLDTEYEAIFPTTEEALSAAKYADDELHGGFHGIRVEVADPDLVVTFKTATQWVIDAPAE